MGTGKWWKHIFDNTGQNAIHSRESSPTEISYFLNCGHILFRKLGEVWIIVKTVLLCQFLSSCEDLKPEVSSAGSSAVMLLLDASDTLSWCIPLPSGLVCSSQISASGLAALLHSWFIFIEFVLHGPDLTLHFHVWSIGCVPVVGKQPPDLCAW